MWNTTVEFTIPTDEYETMSKIITSDSLVPDIKLTHLNDKPEKYTFYILDGCAGAGKTHQFKGTSEFCDRCTLIVSPFKTSTPTGNSGNTHISMSFMKALKIICSGQRTNIRFIVFDEVYLYDRAFLAIFVDHGLINNPETQFYSTGDHKQSLGINWTGVTKTLLDPECIVKRDSYLDTTSRCPQDAVELINQYSNTAGTDGLPCVIKTKSKVKKSIEYHHMIDYSQFFGGGWKDVLQGFGVYDAILTYTREEAQQVSEVVEKNLQVMTIGESQGKTFKNVALIGTWNSNPTALSFNYNYIALSRHTDRLIILGKVDIKPKNYLEAIPKHISTVIEHPIVNTPDDSLVNPKQAAVTSLTAMSADNDQSEPTPTSSLKLETPLPGNDRVIIEGDHTDPKSMRNPEQRNPQETHTTVTVANNVHVTEAVNLGTGFIPTTVTEKPVKVKQAHDRHVLDAEPPLVDIDTAVSAIQRNITPMNLSSVTGTTVIQKPRILDYSGKEMVSPAQTTSSTLAGNSVAINGIRLSDKTVQNQYLSADVLNAIQTIQARYTWSTITQKPKFVSDLINGLNKFYKRDWKTEFTNKLTVQRFAQHTIDYMTKLHTKLSNDPKYDELTEIISKEEVMMLLEAFQSHEVQQRIIERSVENGWVPITMFFNDTQPVGVYALFDPEEKNYKVYLMVEPDANVPKFLINSKFIKMQLLNVDNVGTIIKKCGNQDKSNLVHAYLIDTYKYYKPNKPDDCPGFTNYTRFPWVCKNSKLPNISVNDEFAEADYVSVESSATADDNKLLSHKLRAELLVNQLVVRQDPTHSAVQHIGHVGYKLNWNHLHIPSRYVSNKLIQSFVNKCYDTLLERQNGNLDKQTELSYSIYDWNSKYIRFHLKNQPKQIIKNEYDGMQKSGQGVSAWSKIVNILMAGICRMIDELANKFNKDNVLLAYGESDTNIGRRIQPYAAQAFDDGSIIKVVNDFSEFDSCQDETSIAMFTAIMSSLGVKHETCRYYFNMRKEWLLKYRNINDYNTNFFNVKCFAKRHSGGSDTLIGNTLFNLAVMGACHNFSAIFVSAKGDDLLMFCRHFTPVKGFTSALALELGYKLKLETPVFVEYIANIITPRGFFPDVVRRVGRLAAKIHATKEAWEESRVSIVDSLDVVEGYDDYGHYGSLFAVEYYKQQGFDFTESEIMYMFKLLHSFSKLKWEQIKGQCQTKKWIIRYIDHNHLDSIKVNSIFNL